MTASRLDRLSKLSSPHEALVMRGRARMLFVSLTGALLAACHAGLPPEPPRADPADPAASSAPYQIQPNPYETSAFAGEPAPKADAHAGHGNMNHGSMTDGQAGHEHMGHGSNAGGKQAPAPAARTGPDHSGHGAKAAPKPAASTEPDHSGHGPKAGDKQAPAPAAPVEPDHSGHGAMEKKPPSASDAMPPNMHKQPEPPR